MQLRKIILTWMTLATTFSAGAQVKFDDYFLPKTMRFDYYHAGSDTSEY